PFVIADLRRSARPTRVGRPWSTLRASVSGTWKAPRQHTVPTQRWIDVTPEDLGVPKDGGGDAALPAGRRLDPLRSGGGASVRPVGHASREGGAVVRFSVGKGRLTAGGTERCSSSSAPAAATA